MNLANLQPLHDRILVKILPDAPSATIIIPGIAEERSHRGVVVAAGPGVRDKKGKRRPLDVQPGDEIRFSLHDLEEGEYTLIRQGDVFGFVKLPRPYCPYREEVDVDFQCDCVGTCKRVDDI